ncbi:hypothetical protein RclHR1_32930003 [Rhizophagus clarus]|uniref:SAM domain-containing protein n=1 Tax=Rhizophagus clarus TaxID=94130 RepID=A0A2Z6R8T8_9GLOM|nr:hypothetical protein RclHR1_32930003 [Rhizophagus clarus]GES95195.1 hypothetical protein GLOIN_2v1695250 [Rhizophagus clarus]
MKLKGIQTFELILFLQEKKLGLSEKNKILEKKINSCDFLKMSKEKFRNIGLGLGPASKLANFAKKYKKKKLRLFSSYLSLSEIWYQIISIPLFTPQTQEIQELKAISFSNTAY